MRRRKDAALLRMEEDGEVEVKEAGAKEAKGKSKPAPIEPSLLEQMVDAIGRAIPHMEDRRRELEGDGRNEIHRVLEDLRRAHDTGEAALKSAPTSAPGTSTPYASAGKAIGGLESRMEAMEKELAALRAGRGQARSNPPEEESPPPKPKRKAPGGRRGKGRRSHD